MFVDPRTSAHLQGLELRIIELTRRLEGARRFRLWTRAARLERQRHLLVAEMAEIASRTPRARRPRIHGRPVRTTRPAA